VYSFKPNKRSWEYDKKKKKQCCLSTRTICSLESPKKIKKIFGRAKKTLRIASAFIDERLVYSKGGD
jgi:hypothetical protein